MTAPKPAVLAVAAALAGCATAPAGLPGDTPLCAVLRRHDGAAARGLLENGADPNQAGARGVPPLLLAIDADRDTVAALLDKGARVDVEFNHWTPLPLAVSLGKRDMAELLIQRGAPAAPPGNAPMYQAIARGNMEMVTLLLARGVDASGSAADGRSLVELATYMSRPEIVDELVRHGGKPVGIRGRLGLGFVMKDGRPVVNLVAPDSPAAAAGVRPGEIIAAVNGTPVAGLSQEEVLAKLRGDAGTTAEVMLQGTAGSRSVTMTRQAVGSPSRARPVALSNDKPWWQE